MRVALWVRGTCVRIWPVSCAIVTPPAKAPKASACKRC